jgi:hypothetical protein
VSSLELGQQVSCTCGAGHLGRVVHFITPNLLGVSWQEGSPITADMSKLGSYRSAHYAQGHYVAIDASLVVPVPEQGKGREPVVQG